MKQKIVVKTVLAGLLVYTASVLLLRYYVSNFYEFSLYLYIPVGLAGFLLTARFENPFIGLTSALCLLIMRVLPTTTLGYFWGSDSWKFIGSTQVVANGGWDLANALYNPSTIAFPGLQIYTAQLSAILDVDIILLARYIPLITVIIILPVLLGLFRTLEIELWKGTAALIVIVSYTNFTLKFTFHHFAMGLVGLVTIYYVFLGLQRSGRRHNAWFLILLTVFTTLTISHQFNSVIAGVLLGVGLIALSVYYRLGLPVTKINLQKMDLVVLVAFCIGVTYWIWAAGDVIPDYLVTVLMVSSGSPPTPDPELVQTFVPLFSSTPAWFRLITSVHIMSIIVLGLTFAAMVIVNILQKPQKSTTIEYAAAIFPNERVATLLMWIGAMGMLTVVVKFAVPIVSLQRMLRMTVPLILAGLFIYESRTVESAVPVREIMVTGLSIFIIMNLLIYPGDIHAGGLNEYEHSPFVTEQDQKSYEWVADHGDSIITDTTSIHYFYGLRKGVAATSSQKAYLGCGRGPKDPSLLMVRDVYQTRLFMRAYPYQYALPKQHFEVLSNSICLQDVYSNGGTDIYSREGTN
jgi:hypothetical protein